MQLIDYVVLDEEDLAGRRDLQLLVLNSVRYVRL